MKSTNSTLPAALAASAAFVLALAEPIAAEDLKTVSQAVNFFENAQATGGTPFTVDAKGPVAISGDVELPGFAFQVYDVDFTATSLTMTLVAQLDKLQITQYDDTTFDRYYFEFDHEVTSAVLSDATNANFAAKVEILEPGTTVSSGGAFVDGLPTDFTFANGGILVTIGDGTELTKISAEGGALTVNF